jgi:lysozyme
MINGAGLALLREYEGCRLQAYLDAGGIATIGYGHTQEVRLGQSCSQEQAEAWLAEDAERAFDGVLASVRVPMSENEAAACAVFAFNVGAANFRGSSVYRLVNQGDRAGAARAFLLWDKARVNGRLVALPGLARRRAAEAHLFLTPDAAPDAPTIAPPPEETGVSSVEPPPAIGGGVSAGTALAAASGAAGQAIERLQPVRDGLELMGFSVAWIAAALALLLGGALAYVAWTHLQARKALRA